ncbi:MAG TPA: SDR family NAD(P)-dependent oxidoreductase [Candidatus Limnocylindria bacterium]|nr:SDR family NAD(P)-dependent oxidoreductase [Candidatus Limnocylindria bacterium]
MSQEKPKRVVLITGAGGGLGRALLNEFASSDWHVIAGIRALAADTDSSLALDVTQPEQIDRAVGSVTKRFGRIDALINNAGVTADALCSQLKDADWTRVLDVNLRGAFLCSKAVARSMMRQREGHIINISSFGARSGPAGQSNYAAAKAGLVGLTHSLAKELGSRNVRVNAIFPGVMSTNMTAHMSAERLEAFAQSNALGRINSVEEVARFIVFLATTQNISGQVFQLDSRIAPWT